jgi:ribonuclease D
MRIITDTAALKVLAAELERGPYVAIDTEFMRDQTYWPKLCLIQAAGPGGEAIIDPLAKDIDLKPFYRLMAAKSVIKVFHAARQDIEIFHHQGDVIPDPFFDTQIAAMVCGFGEAAYETRCASSPRRRSTNRRVSLIGAAGRSASVSLEYALADVTI